MQLLVEDSLEYFNPEPGESDEEIQKRERLQRNRQDIMQAEGLVSLLLKLIDKITIYTATQNLQFLHKDQVKPLEELLGMVKSRPLLNLMLECNNDLEKSTFTNF